MRYGDEAGQLYNRISRTVARIGVEGGQNILKVMNRFDDGGQLALKFLKVVDIPGAQKLINNLAGGAWEMVKGTRFELDYAVQHADEIAEIGRKLGGGREIDFVTKAVEFVDVKNYNWAADFYQTPSGLEKVITRFKDQAFEYLRHSNRVTFAFNGSVPDAVRAALEALGVAVEVIP